MKPAIRVENLSKRYRIGPNKPENYKTLRESLTDAVAAPVHALRRVLRNPSALVTQQSTEFWALKDVSFEVQPGDVVGVIGRNGAGKSTLLKILSRVTEPTGGRVQVRGHMASLLEVGTGFHPELTGRENIFLNGSLLGMSRNQIQKKFDEIVDFAEIAQFLDTPVKRYSSGMYVRLAFAIAAHLEPEILVVDEVLAVGDASYQRRCVNRMRELAHSGKTILFVSHNMDLIPRLCKQAILLEQGKVIKTGAAASTCEYYLRYLTTNDNNSDLRHRTRSGDGRARFTRFELINDNGVSSTFHYSGHDLVLKMEIHSIYDIPDVAIAAVIKTLREARIVTSWTKEVNFPFNICSGKQEVICRFERLFLRPGHRFQIELWMEARGVMDYVNNAGVFSILPAPGTEHYSTDVTQGPALCKYRWEKGVLKETPKTI